MSENENESRVAKVLNCLMKKACVWTWDSFVFQKLRNINKHFCTENDTSFFYLFLLKTPVPVEPMARVAMHMTQHFSGK